MALAAAWTVFALVPGAAAAKNCPELPIGDCSTVEVPLDRTGAVPGTVNLAVARVPAARQPSRGTILFLAGGPGESALAGGENLVSLFRRNAPNYDLLTFDQRGTGRSGGLNCSALTGRGSEASVFGRCGAQLGAKRSFYRTSDSVEDIEAVRAAAGGGPISILGVSYGGRVAGEYVRRYPAAVSRLVLDSPSTLAGTDPFFLQRQRALPRVLRSICGARLPVVHPLADRRHEPGGGPAGQAVPAHLRRDPAGHAAEGPLRRRRPVRAGVAERPGPDHPRPAARRGGRRPARRRRSAGPGADLHGLRAGGPGPAGGTGQRRALRRHHVRRGATALEPRIGAERGPRPGAVRPPARSWAAGRSSPSAPAP